MAKNSTSASASASALPILPVAFELATKHGTVGTVDIADFHQLPASTQRYIIDYGFRKSLQDAIAACKDDIEAAKGLFTKRLDSLMAGTMGTRTASPANALQKEVRRLADIAIKSRLRAKGVAASKISKEVMATALTKYIAANEARLAVEAQANLDAVAALDVGLDDSDDIFAAIMEPEAE